MKLNPCPPILGLFEKRMDGDDALLAFAKLRFREAHLGAEYHAGSPAELEHLLTFRPSPETPAAVHLPRGLDLFEEATGNLLKIFASEFAGRLFGLILHDQNEMETNPEAYRRRVGQLNSILMEIPDAPFLFIEYAVGLDPNVFVSFFKTISPLKKVSACIDIGHLGLRAAQSSYAKKHQDRDLFSLKLHPEDFRASFGDLRSALDTGMETVLRTIRELSLLKKHVHFHLHDAHPLSTSPEGISDHLSFLDKVPLPFQAEGAATVDPMFGKSGLFKIATEAVGLFGPKRVSFTLEIHPDGRRLALGSASYLFDSWKDVTNAEKTNSWLSLLIKNQESLLDVCRPPAKAESRPRLIYNIFPLLAGKLHRWQPHLSRAAGMGFTWIFINPLQKPGFSGSLYSIADYFSINPAFLETKKKKEAGDQVREMVRAAEDLGLKVMVDLVINHCAIDAEIIKTHPEWFELEPDGTVAHPFADRNGEKVVWGDLAKFDFQNTDKEGLFRYLVAVIDYLAELGFRGFRCDAAYQVPAELWQKIITETRQKYPDALFLAETLGCTPELTRETAGAGFDFIFNSAKWWDFEAGWLLDQYEATRDAAPSISFPESHDTPRLFAELEGSIPGMKLRYLFAALFSAGVMIPIGFEFGFRKALHVVNTKPEDWEKPATDLTSFIREVNGIKTAHEVFMEDAVTRVLPSDSSAVLLLWKKCGRTGTESLLLLNTDPKESRSFSLRERERYFDSGGPVTDISPGKKSGPVSLPLSGRLGPGEGMILAVFGTDG